ncbi:MAG: hypothetical protein LBS87_02805 [Puniceicoccales bacterium]|jgi:hypothetical protein|nr:hypothetical protein [Puniceicoccales bacterium]
MGIAEVDMLQIDVGPSRYFISQDGSARLVGWQIGLADSSWRNVVSNGGNFRCQLNVRAMPVAGLREFEATDVEFVRCPDAGECVIFGPKDLEQCRMCVPKFSYKLLDLSVRIEMILDNIGTFPLHWCPVICVPIHLSWHDNLSIDQYFIRSKAKKKFILNNDLSVVESSKCSDKLPIALSEYSVLAVSGMQDYKVSIATKNGEETLSVIFCGKYPNAYFALKQTERCNCVELLCMPDLPCYDADFKDWPRYRCVQPSKSDSFTIELSVC